MLIAELVIPQMFTAYAEDIKYLDSGLHHIQYFCEECDQVFSSAWGKIPGSMAYFERGNYFYCPYCGKLHQKNVAFGKRNQPVPNKVRLSVKEYKNVVTFDVSCKTVYFNDFLSLYEGYFKETFRFDISQQTVTHSVNDNGRCKDPIELGNPFKLEMFDSILGFFMANSIPNSENRSGLSNLLKTLRETVHRKLEKHLGHKVSSMYVSPGTYHGTFLLPIFNIAYRVTCPDAPNLPHWYREEPEILRKFWSSKMHQTDYMDDVIVLTRRKKDFVSALIETKSLPDKPLIRRSLREDPFGINVLVKAFELCENYDCAIRMYSALKQHEKDLFYSRNDEDLIGFLHQMKPIYGENGIIRLVEEAKEFQIGDCINLYRQLNADNKKALKTETVRLRDLHDWMSLRHKKQTHKNMKFEVPDHIVNRLSMQTDRLKFFLPKESIELLVAGHELHNCVGSYGHAMKDNKKWIVLVADDNGKLAACLEITGKEVVQAKVDRNKSVLSDSKLNSAVVAWAKEANLEIKTSDIKVPDKSKLAKTG